MGGRVWLCNTWKLHEIQLLLYVLLEHSHMQSSKACLQPVLALLHQSCVALTEIMWPTSINYLTNYLPTPARKHYRDRKMESLSTEMWPGDMWSQKYIRKTNHIMYSDTLCWPVSCPIILVLYLYMGCTCLPHVQKKGGKDRERDR